MSAMADFRGSGQKRKEKRETGKTEAGKLRATFLMLVSVRHKTLPVSAFPFCHNRGQMSGAGGGQMCGQCVECRTSRRRRATQTVAVVVSNKRRRVVVVVARSFDKDRQRRGGGYIYMYTTQRYDPTDRRRPGRVTGPAAIYGRREAPAPRAQRPAPRAARPAHQLLTAAGAACVTIADRQPVVR